VTLVQVLAKEELELELELEVGVHSDLYHPRVRVP